MEKNLYKKLSFIQEKLKAPKNQYNRFGKYNYRSCEDILEGLKPYLRDLGLVLNLFDDIEVKGNRYYIKATAKLIDVETSEFIESYAYAREAENKKGMDSAQVTGATSSYARKYALNGLFAIDDTKDSDYYNNEETIQNSKPKQAKKQVKNTPRKPADKKTVLIENMFDTAKQAGIELMKVKERMASEYQKTSSADLTEDEIVEITSWIAQQSFL